MKTFQSISSRVSLLLIVSFCSSLAIASPLLNIDPLLHKRFEGGLHVYPNESNPIDGLYLYRKLPSGLFISVGTERGLLSAANAPNVTHLLLADYSLDVYHYNRMQILLLKMARDIRDYIWLRYRSDETREDIAKRNERIKKLPAADQKFFIDHQNALQLIQMDPSRLKESPFKFGRKEGRYEFQDMNYLESESKFQKLSQMAKADQMMAIAIDSKALTNLPAFRILLKATETF